MKIGIIACEDAPGWGGEQGLCDHITKKFMECDSQIEDVYVHFKALSGHLPKKEEIPDFDGFVISGSHYSVNDGNEWSKKLEELIITLKGIDKGPKLFGICFGHQLIAKALGGKVEQNPTGNYIWGTGIVETVDILRSNDIFQHKVFSKDRREFKIMQSRGEYVSVLPEGASCLGKSAFCEYEMLKYGDSMMSLQGHPEVDRQTMMKKILPRLRESKLLNEEEEKMAAASLCDEDQKKLMKFVKLFLGSK